MAERSGFKLEAGQIWSYYNRPDDPDSKLLILRVDTFGKERVIHVTIIGGEFEYSSHMPFSEDAINRSVIEHCGRVRVLPEWEEGYGVWRKAWEAQQAGIYKITVGEVLML